MNIELYQILTGAFGSIISFFLIQEFMKRKNNSKDIETIKITLAEHSQLIKQNAAVQSEIKSLTQTITKLSSHISTLTQKLDDHIKYTEK